MQELGETMQGRTDVLDKKIQQKNQQLSQMKQQLDRMPANSPARAGLKRRMIEILKQKKQLESRSGNMQSQVMNMDSVTWALDDMKNAQVVTQAMKAGTKELKKALKKTNINEIERMKDRMEEMQDEVADVNEVLSQPYETEVLDDADLEAELDALGDDMFADTDTSYLDTINDTPSDVPTLPAQPSSTETTKVDDFGLPVV